MLEKLRLLQYRARIKLYRAEQMRTIDVSGYQASLLADGVGEPLVYLHSFIGESIWYPFHEGLSRSFAVTAPMHPGLGSADGNAEIGDLDDLIFYYLDLFATLGLDRFHLVGASFGGRIAAEFALRYPERIKRLILVDSFGLEMPEAPIADLSAMGEIWGRRLFYNPRSFLGDLLLSDLPEEREQALRPVARIGASNPKLKARLRRITAPTLLLWGAEDVIVPLAHAHAFQAAIPDARLTTIEKCGHLPMFEQEEKFVAAVASFLRAG